MILRGPAAAVPCVSASCIGLTRSDDALTSAAVYVWGRGEYGRLGLGDRTGSSKLRPTRVKGMASHRYTLEPSRLKSSCLQTQDWVFLQHGCKTRNECSVTCRSVLEAGNTIDNFCAIELCRRLLPQGGAGGVRWHAHAGADGRGAHLHLGPGILRAARPRRRT